MARDFSFLFLRCTRMLMYSTLLIIHGVVGLICRKRWQILIWEWQLMVDIFMLSRDNMVPNVEDLWPVPSCLILKQRNGARCHLYPAQGMSARLAHWKQRVWFYDFMTQCIIALTSTFLVSERGSSLMKLHRNWLLMEIEVEIWLV